MKYKKILTTIIIVVILSSVCNIGLYAESILNDEYINQDYSSDTVILMAELKGA